MKKSGFIKTKINNLISSYLLNNNIIGENTMATNEPKSSRKLTLAEKAKLKAMEASMLQGKEDVPTKRKMHWTLKVLITLAIIALVIVFLPHILTGLFMVFFCVGLLVALVKVLFTIGFVFLPKLIIYGSIFIAVVAVLAGGGA